MNYFQIFGTASVVLQLYCMLPYFLGIFRKKVIPHAFTWLLWGLLGGIAFVIQIKEGAGAGAWLTGVNTFESLIIALIAFKVGQKNISPDDWVFLVFGLCAIPLWLLTNNPLWSMLMVWLINAVAFWPTVRKSWHYPFEESLQTFFLGGVSAMLAAIAVEHIAFITLFYPLWLVFSNFAFVAMAYRRRQIIKE